MKTFENIASLKLATLKEGQFVETGGYYSKGDGGGARYLIVTPQSADEYGDHTLANGNVAVLQHSGSVNVKQYGAKADNTTDDLASLRAIVSASNGRFSISASPRDQFYLGVIPDTGDFNALTIDFDGFTFRTNNCQFRVVANLVNPTQRLFYFEDASDVTVGDFSVEGTNVEIPPGSGAGLRAIVLHSVAKNSSKVAFGKVRVNNCFVSAGCSSFDPLQYRYSDITFSSLECNNGYYGINFTDNGDNLTAKVLSDGVVRSYFPYGVSDHKIDVYSKNHPTFTDILIKRYSIDTKNIDVKYVAVNDLSPDSAVTIEHQNDTDDGLIYNVNVQYDIQKANTADKFARLSSYTNAGVLRSTTSSRSDKIKLVGATNSFAVLDIATALTGYNLSRVECDETILGRLPNTKRWIIKNSNGEQIVVGDQDSSFIAEINLSEYQFYPFGLHIDVWSAEGATGSYANSIATGLMAVGTVNSIGSITIAGKAGLSTQASNGTAATIDLTGNGVGSWFANLTTTYNSAGSRIVGRVRKLSGGIDR